MINTKKLKNGLSHGATEARKELDEIRSNIASIDEEIQWLANAPLVLDDVNLKIDGYVAKNATNSGIDHFFYDHQAGGPGVLSGDMQIKHGQLRVQAESWVMGSAQVDISRAMCALFPGLVAEGLKNMAKHESKNHEAGPPLAERPELKNTLLKRKYDYEVAEESLICEAEELGLIGFYRRGNCNPEIVLMVA